MNLTKEALEGFRSLKDGQSPYLLTSPSDMAWRVGRYMANNGWGAPADLPSRDLGRRVVNSGRGYKMSVRGRCDVLLGRFEVRYALSGEARVTELSL